MFYLIVKNDYSVSNNLVLIDGPDRMDLQKEMIEWQDKMIGSRPDAKLQEITTKMENMSYELVVDENGAHLAWKNVLTEEERRYLQGKKDQILKSWCQVRLRLTVGAFVEDLKKKYPIEIVEYKEVDSIFDY